MELVASTVIVVGMIVAMWAAVVDRLHYGKNNSWIWKW